MPPKRRKFSRPLGERRYRKIFILAVEGIKTEPQYFAVFNDQNSVIRVNCLKGKHDSSPRLKLVQRHGFHVLHVSTISSREFGPEADARLIAEFSRLQRTA